MKKQIRFYTKEKGWSKWQNMDTMKIPDEMLKVETKEQMTLGELKKYPDLYKKAMEQLSYSSNH